MGLKGKVETIDQKSNLVQRLIVAIVVPILIVLMGWGIMNILDHNGPLRHHITPDDLDESWWAWLIIISCIGIFEYVWFRNRD